MIYFIEAVGANRVKIGFTEGEPEARLKALQTGCPHPLRLLVAFPGAQSVEKQLHEQFANLRTQGEWFDLNCSTREVCPRRPH